MNALLSAHRFQAFSLAAILAVCGAASFAHAQTGACCIAGACTLTSQAACVGSFQGNSSCSPNPCAALGVCCRGATCNSGITSAVCTSANSAAGSSFTTAESCNASGNAKTPCCYADYNKSGSITVQDIFDFLHDWFAGSPYAKVGGNGTSGTPTVQDIFDFLAAWFTKGC